MEHWNYSPGLIPPFEPYYKRRYVMGVDPYSKELADEITSEGQKNLRDIADVVQANSLDEAKDAIKRIQSKAKGNRKVKPRYITFDIETGGLNDELKVFQSIGRMDRSKNSPHTQGLAMDIHVTDTPEYWRNAANYFARPTQSDRIISHMMLLEATRREMDKHLGIPKELLGGISQPTVNVIRYPELLNELLNYKPKEMKQFKGNKLAVTGDIIELLKFEKALKELGYKNTGGRGDVFHYRGDKGISVYVYTRDENKIANFITIGLHYCAKKPGQYTPARNDGNAKDYGVHFTLPQDFDKALKLAGELSPLFYTHDGTAVYDTTTKIHGVRKLDNDDRKGHYALGKYDAIYRNHQIISINYSNQKSDLYTWFSSVELAKQFIDNTVPLLITEDGITKFVNDQAYCVKPDFTTYCVKKGLDEKSPWPGYKYFNNSKAAQLYIDENKPQFSKKQIRDIVNNSVSKMDVLIPGYRSLVIHHIDGEKLKKGFNL